MNWGVLVAAIASFIFGWLFYSNVLFGPLWLKLSKIDKKEQKEMASSPMAGRMITALISSIVTAWVLLFFMGKLTINSYSGAIPLVFKIWLGFLVSTTLIGGVLWENKSVKLFFLNSIYWLLNLIIISFVLLSFY